MLVWNVQLTESDSSLTSPSWVDEKSELTKTCWGETLTHSYLVMRARWCLNEWEKWEVWALCVCLSAGPTLSHTHPHLILVCSKRSPIFTRSLFLSFRLKTMILIVFCLSLYPHWWEVDVCTFNDREKKIMSMTLIFLFPSLCVCFWLAGCV